jgi:hypothetical protein
MVYGEPLTLPGDFVDSSTPPPVNCMQQLRDKMSRFQPPPTRPVPVQQVSHQEAALHKAQFVYIRRGAAASSISPLYSGPYRVISGGENTFHVDIGGRDEVVSADRLKPHLGLSPLQPTVPPRRGRPPASSDGGIGGRDNLQRKRTPVASAKGGSVAGDVQEILQPVRSLYAEKSM